MRRSALECVTKASCSYGSGLFLNWQRKKGKPGDGPSSNCCLSAVNIMVSTDLGLVFVWLWIQCSERCTARLDIKWNTPLLFIFNVHTVETQDRATAHTLAWGWLLGVKIVVMFKCFKKAKSVKVLTWDTSLGLKCQRWKCYLSIHPCLIHHFIILLSCIHINITALPALTCTLTSDGNRISWGDWTS